NLKVAARMCFEKIEEFGIHERLAAKDSEKAVAMLFGVVDQIVQSGQIDRFAWRFDIDPATVAAQVATIDNREIKKRRKEFAAFDSPFEALDREHSLNAKIPGEFPNEARVSRAENADSETG